MTRVPDGTGREPPDPAVRVVVYVGLVVLVVTVAAFLWLFVVGHGFEFPY